MAHGRRVAPTGRLEPLGSQEGENREPEEREKQVPRSPELSPAKRTIPIRLRFPIGTLCNKIRIGHLRD